jgi:hypothetical protein
MNNEVRSVGYDETRQHKPGCPWLAWLIGANGRRPACTCAGSYVVKRDGRGRHPLFWTWKSMVRRCTSQSSDAYKDYGGRGIRVCDAWLNSFWRFVEDMGPKPEGFTLDRENNDGHYEPGNCRWADRTTQARNSRVRKYDVPDDAPALREYGERLGISRQAAWYRIQKFGWAAVWNGAGASKRHPLPANFQGQL